MIINCQYNQWTMQRIRRCQTRWPKRGLHKQAKTNEFLWIQNWNYSMFVWSSSMLKHWSICFKLNFQTKRMGLNFDWCWLSGLQLCACSLHSPRQPAVSANPDEMLKLRMSAPWLKKMVCAVVQGGHVVMSHFGLNNATIKLSIEFSVGWFSIAPIGKNTKIENHFLESLEIGNGFSILFCQICTTTWPATDWIPDMHVHEIVFTSIYSKKHSRCRRNSKILI